MFELEKIQEKIMSGTWNKEDASFCVACLDKTDVLNGYANEIYLVSYGIFAYSYREYVFSMIEVCQRALECIESFADRAKLHLALMRLYFVTGFQPKIVEYGLKYAGSGYTNRSDLKSAYNCIMIAFTENGLFNEAKLYLEKMIDVTRKEPCKAGVDFWKSDIVNEFVYLDSLVYIELGLGNVKSARDAVERLELLVSEQIPHEHRNFFDIQKEFTKLYFLKYQNTNENETLQAFADYVRQLKTAKVESSGVSLCMRYFAEFLEWMFQNKRYKDVIEIGEFVTCSGLFTGNCGRIYRLMAESAKLMPGHDMEKRMQEFEAMYIKSLERERESYSRMIKTLTKEELRIVTLREAMACDHLTGCRNRSAFEREGRRYLDDHPQGTLVFIDMDHLKEINDKFGHDKGDKYLSDFAQMMEKTLNSSEVLYRYAGDEFIIMSDQSKVKMEVRMDALLKREPFEFYINQKIHKVSFSYGVVEFKEMPGDIYGLIREADHRMYLCKKENHVRLLRSIE